MLCSIVTDFRQLGQLNGASVNILCASLSRTACTFMLGCWRCALTWAWYDTDGASRT